MGSGSPNGKGERGEGNRIRSENVISEKNKENSPFRKQHNVLLYERDFISRYIFIYILEHFHQVWKGAEGHVAQGHQILMQEATVVAIVWVSGDTTVGVCACVCVYA